MRGGSVISIKSIRTTVWPIAAAIAAAIAIAFLFGACEAQGLDSPSPWPSATPSASSGAGEQVPNESEASSPTPAPMPTPTPAPLAVIVADAPVTQDHATDIPSVPAPTPLAAAQQTPRFEPAPCMFPPRERVVECGWLVVPESRRDRDSRTIRLAVAVFESDSPTPAPDPVVYLAGGPGEHALELLTTAYAENDFDRIFRPFLADRDLVLFDQRGVGWSEPALECPEIAVAVSRLAAGGGVLLTDAARRIEDSVLACRDRLVDKGVDLAAYTSAESAADVNDLRLALGYDEWNVYGVSYGTRLGLTLLRDYPEGVRGIILDSPYPLEVDYYAEALPNLERVVDEVIGDVLATADLSSLLQGVALSLDQIDGDLLALLVGDTVRRMESVSLGMHLSVQCAEEASFSGADAVLANVKERPLLRIMAQLGLPAAMTFFDVCDSWGAAEPSPVENQPVRSDVPALVLTGTRDVVTPSSWSKLVAASLSQSTLAEFLGLGHAVLFWDDCPGEIAASFLTAPEAGPAMTCLDP